MADRFDLEQDLLKCWEVVDDLKFYIAGSDKWTEDDRMNYLSGLAVKYDKKFDAMFRLFEDLVHQGAFETQAHSNAFDSSFSSDHFRDAYDHEMYLDSLSER